MKHYVKTSLHLCKCEEPSTEVVFMDLWNRQQQKSQFLNLEVSGGLERGSLPC